MKDPRPKLMMVTAFVLALAALLAGPAQARVVDTDGSTVASGAQQPYDGGQRAIQTPTIIPYLSHGLGVQSTDDGGSVASRQIVPYLSHGIGVDASQFQGLRGDDGVDRGWYTGLEYADLPPVASDSGDGLGWRDGGITAGAAALLLAVASGVFLTTRQRTRVAMP